jgi:hypothetical protein
LLGKKLLHQAAAFIKSPLLTRFNRASEKGFSLAGVA